MKVAELIAKLQELPQDVEVLIIEPEYWEGDREERDPNVTPTDGRLVL